MCFLLLAINQSNDYPFILAANRDEFYQRKSSPLSFWQDKPHILGGRDIEHNGTWMAVSKTGKFAAITNYRETETSIKAQRSRGLLVSDFLESDIEVGKFSNVLHEQAYHYDGFNLIYGELPNHLFYISNRNSNKTERLADGIYGLSNHLLNSPWPKVIHGKQSFKQIISKQNKAIETALFELLSDETKANEEELPSTGVGKNLEHLLSSIYIESEHYGTRCSSILALDKQNNLEFSELTYNRNSCSNLIKKQIRLYS